MRPTRSLEDVVRLITPVLNDWELFYVVVEDLAKRIYGFPREFTEMELLVNLREEDATKFGRYLTSENLPLVEQDGLNTIYRDTKGDTSIRLTKGQDQLDMMTIGRRVVQDFSYSTVLVASVEDLILRELRRGSRSDRQEAIDLYSYWRNHLDISYMVRTSRQFGLYSKFIKMKKKGDRR